MLAGFEIMTVGCVNILRVQYEALRAEVWPEASGQSLLYFAFALTNQTTRGRMEVFEEEVRQQKYLPTYH